MTDAPNGATPAPRAPRRASRRFWLYALGFSIGWKLVLFTMGAAVPRWFIDDGVTHIPAAMQTYAIDAKQTARALWNNPIERLGVIRTVRVVSVDSTQLALAPECGGLSAHVRAYTYFAIPYSEVRTLCHRGVVEYRVFPRRR